ncbi:MAG: hypothetical protein KJ983_02020 [Candidatus Omnitrophica bacterium]|nr:hypothetical protein [Candidatus Omnitrophota bacterium]
MLETPHVIVGAAIAFKITNPLLALPLALGSHFILDMTPHWNPHLNTETKKFGKPTKRSVNIVIADVCLSLVAGFFIASKALPNSTHALTILATCFLSVLPDVIEGPYFFLEKRSDFIKKWIKFQTSIQANVSILPGLATQFLTILAAFWWIQN